MACGGGAGFGCLVGGATTRVRPYGVRGHEGRTHGCFIAALRVLGRDPSRCSASALVARPWARLTAWAPPANPLLISPWEGEGERFSQAPIAFGTSPAERGKANCFRRDGCAQSGLPSSIDRILPIWSCSLSSWRVRVDVFRIHERSSRPWAGIPCELASLARVPLRFAKGTGGSAAHLRPVSRKGRVARRLICVPFHERDGWLVSSSASRFAKGTGGSLAHLRPVSRKGRMAHWLICVPV